jgi:glycosyltransferase involved in cell wall biosynthesis
VNVLCASEYFPPFAPGGGQWNVLALGRALAARGHEFQVVTPNYGALAEETIDGVRVRRFPIAAKLAPGQGSVPLRSHLNPAFLIRYGRELCRAGRASRPDVVLACLPFSILPSLVAARVLGVPCVVEFRDPGYGCPIATCMVEGPQIPRDCGQRRLWRHCSGFFIEHYLPGGRGHRFATRLRLAALYAFYQGQLRALRWCGGALFVSHSLRDIYRNAGQIPLPDGRLGVRHSTFTLGAGAMPPDPASIRRRYGVEGRRIVLYAGKLSLGKGTYVLARAAELVASEVPDATFLLAGKGVIDLPKGRADVRRLGVVPRDDMPGLYASADVVVHPAVWPEPLSQSLLDAGVFGKPVVASRVGGTPEVVIDGETGILVPPRDAEALARALSGLLRDESQRARLGANAGASVRSRFSADATVFAFLQFCRSIGVREAQQPRAAAKATAPRPAASAPGSRGGSAGVTEA